MSASSVVRGTADLRSRADRSVLNRGHDPDSLVSALTSRWPAPCSSPAWALRADADRAPENLLDSLFTAFVAGLVFDFLNADHFMLSALVCMARLSHSYLRAYQFFVIELMILLLLSIIFVKELLLYFYMTASNLSGMSVMTWLSKRLVTTLVGNLAPILLCDLDE